MTALTKILAAILLTAAALSAQGRHQGIDLESQVGKALYGAGDTVVAGIRAVIPRGFHLYANPLGPGIGKPLNLYVAGIGGGDASCWEIDWIEAYKSVPKRYNPPIGSWVWAYDGEAFFFVKGVLRKKTGDATANNSAGNAVLPHTVTIDALICRTSCIPIVQSVAFAVSASAEPVNGPGACAACSFPTAPAWQTRFARSERMEFRIGSPQGAEYAGIGGDTSQTGAAGIDLSGLSSLHIGDPPGLTGIRFDSTMLAPSLVREGRLGIDSSYAQLEIIGKATGGDFTDEGLIVWDYAPLEEKRREYNLLTAIIFALFAGLALNLTPCIFPVLSVRILSFAESARESRRRAVIRSLAFSGGIVSVFLLLAALAAFAGLSWGQQFQNPGVMLGIIALIFLFALGMFGFYTMIVPSAISNAERKTGAGISGDFLKGAIATVMATPCGGPFLGALLAWALLQKPAVIFAVFAVMGAGMALPYVLLSSNRRLMGLLPKPGRWIEDLKHAMGFLLLIFAVNLMTSLDPRLVVTAVGICLSILCAASVNKRFAPFGAELGRRVTVLLIAAAVIAAGTVLSVTLLRLDIPYLNDEPITEELAAVRWREFSPAALKAAHEEGRNVIVNFTASWCTNCKLNAAATLNAAESKQLYIDKNILLLTADITNQNPQAQSLLHHLGSRSIPFLAIFPADSPQNPIIMRDIISKNKYTETLRGLP